MAIDPDGSMQANPASLADDMFAFAYGLRNFGNQSFAMFRGLDAMGNGTGIMARIDLDAYRTSMNGFG
jgi:hypothetical protein